MWGFRMRFDEQDRDWPARPWIMAAIGAAGGLIIHLLTDGHNYSTPLPVWKQAATTFTAIAVLSFLLTVELRRWTWAIAFALGWGVAIALVGWFTAQYNQVSDIFEFPFWSGILAVLIAAPLFQTIRDEGAWRFPYARLHRHAWTDAVIGAAALVFVGISFLLAWLIAALFDLIGLDLVKKLLQKDWFGWVLAGFAFGAAIGLLRERDALVGTLQRLVMVVMGVLAPVLGAALLLFLLSIPFTGLSKLWDSSIPATPMMLLAGAGAILLANAVIGNGADDRATSRILRISAQALVLAVLPLAIIAAVSLGQRIGQYGLTPERMWGVVAVGVAIAYGLVGWWVVAKGRNDFDDLLRPLQTKLALGLCALALFLALPILDFGLMSAASQMNRLTAGKVTPAEFDWKAMAFDFGPAGRARLTIVATSGPTDQRTLATAALASKNRYEVEEEVKTADSAAKLDTRLRVVPEGTVLPPELRSAIAATRFCRVESCVVMLVGESRALVAGPTFKDDTVVTATIARDAKGDWSQVDSDPYPPKPPFRPNLTTAPVELRTVERRQIYIDGTPVGDPIE
jgi:hypothetical protein